MSRRSGLISREVGAQGERVRGVAKAAASRRYGGCAAVVSPSGKPFATPSAQTRLDRDNRDAVIVSRKPPEGRLGFMLLA